LALGYGGTSLDRLSSAGTDSEDDKLLSGLWESWYAYTDKEAGYENGSAKNGQAKSSITNTKFTAKDENNSCKETEAYRVILQDGSDWTVKIPSYTLDQGTYKYEPFVGLGLDARKNGSTYNLSSCTNGFSYQYKGSAHKFKVLSSAIKEGSGEDHYKNITSPATSWTTVIIPPEGELQQPTWVTNKTPFSLAKVRGWSWELVGSASAATEGLSAKTGSLAIKDFKCLGTMTLPAKPTFQCRSNTGGASSSSAKSSSSSVVASSSSGASSSSVSSSSFIDASSSSEEDDTPIISLKPIINGVSTFKNGVYLQVSNKANIEVFGLSGKSMRKMDFSTGSHSVSLSDLPKGLYIVMVKFDNQKQILRVPVK